MATVHGRFVRTDSEDEDPAIEWVTAQETYLSQSQYPYADVVNNWTETAIAVLSTPRRITDHPGTVTIRRDQLDALLETDGTNLVMVIVTESIPSIDDVTYIVADSTARAQGMQTVFNEHGFSDGECKIPWPEFPAFEWDEIDERAHLVAEFAEAINGVEPDIARRCLRESTELPSLLRVRRGLHLDSGV